MESEDAVRRAKEARERVLQDCRERVVRLSAELTRALVRVRQAGEQDREAASKACRALEQLMAHSLVESRERVERASEAVHEAELADLKEDAARVVRALEEALAGAGSRPPELVLEAMRTAVDGVNRVLGKARGIEGRAQSDVRTSAAARERYARQAEEARARADPAAASRADLERSHWEVACAREQAHAREARAILDLLAQRKERALELLRKLVRERPRASGEDTDG